jgi:hypothetical protein
MPEAAMTDLVDKLAEQCTFWTAEEWAQFLALSPNDQSLVARALKQSAIAPNVDKLKVAILILEAIVTVGSGVGAVAGGAQALRAIL